MIVGKQNCDKIRKTFSELDQSEGCSFSQGIWALKNKTFPKVSGSVPAAKKDDLDSNMSDSSIGARRGRNTQNHTFVVNSIINHSVVKKNTPVDLAICDFRKAFDILSPTIVNNDLYKLGTRLAVDRVKPWLTHIVCL